MVGGCTSRTPTFIVHDATCADESYTYQRTGVDPTVKNEPDGAVVFECTTPQLSEAVKLPYVTFAPQ